MRSCFQKFRSYRSVIRQTPTQTIHSYSDCLPGLISTNYYVKSHDFSQQMIKFINYFHNYKYGTASSVVSCWKCRNVLKPFAMVCDKCESVQLPQENVNYFHLLGFAEEFDLDLTALSSSLKKLQMVMHPDKYSMKSADEIQMAESYSSLINKAYSTLRNPWTRGVYLLQCRGVEFSESTTIDNPELLMTVMERNEEVASADSMEQLLKLDKINKEETDFVIERLSQAFQNNNLESALTELVQLKYYINLDSKISERKLLMSLEK